MKCTLSDETENTVVLCMAGVGGGLVPWTLQQRLVRSLPSERRAHSLQFGGQEHSRVGHAEAYEPPRIPVSLAIFDLSGWRSLVVSL